MAALTDEPTDELAQLWLWFADSLMQGYSPLYDRIARAVATDTATLDLVRSAPPEAHLPLLLLAAVHFLLLEEPDHPLAQVYAGSTDADPAPLFLGVCHDRWDELRPLMVTRHVQTNDCGRAALIGPALTWAAGRSEGPLALVDVGASAGLSLLCDRYRLDYGDRGATGPAGSPVEIHCEVLGGHPPIAPALPPLASRVGIDRSPVDLSDPEDARWLLACVWPDTGRLERTAASIRLAQEDLPEVVEGDANGVLPGLLERLPEGTTAVVLTTWAFSYFSVEQRSEFLDLLGRASHRRTVIWLSADAAGVVEGLATGEPPVHGEAAADVLAAVVFEGGRADHRLLGFVQPHGRWLDWRAPAP
jgi:hypothetical protein